MPPPYHLPEAPFIPGVDPGLKAWLRMRESLRESAKKFNGERVETIPNGIKYKYHRYWNDMLLPHITTSANSMSTSVKSMEEFSTMCADNINDALRYALKASHSRFLIYAMPHVININEVLDEHRNTALHIAAYEGDQEKVALLLTHYDIQVNALNDRLMSPLFFSIRMPVVGFHPQSIQQMLIEHQANVSLQNNRGFTALHQACLHNNTRLIALLLENRARVYILDHKGKVPIEYVSEQCYEEACALFMQYLKKRGRLEHKRMWAHIMSRQIVKSVFK